MRDGLDMVVTKPCLAEASAAKSSFYDKACKCRTKSYYW